MKSWKRKTRGGGGALFPSMPLQGVPPGVTVTLYIYFFTCVGIFYSFSCSLNIQSGEIDVECFACEYTNIQLLDDVKS